jgi:MFS superfamily sulfate permease-like transporter
MGFFPLSISAILTICRWCPFLYSTIERLPMAALTGLMIMVAIGTFEWASIKMIGRMPKLDIFVGMLVAESRVADMPGIEALNKITDRYNKAGKRLHLKHLSPDCRQLLKNAEKVIDVNIIEDPTYHVAVDKV